MEILFTSITGSTLEGSDGYVGTLQDIFFCSDTWLVRYVVVDTGKWLAGRHVVLSPHILQQVDWPMRKITVPYTRDQIKDSPSVYEHEPVSRQMEQDLADYFQWPSYWGPDDPVTRYRPREMPPPHDVPDTSSTTAEREREELQPSAGANLRSAAEMTGYQMDAEHQKLGYVADFAVDIATWAIRRLLIKTYRWLTAQDVLVSPHCVDHVSWQDRSLHVHHTMPEQVTPSSESPSEQSPSERR